MEYYKIGPNKFVEINGDRAQVFSRTTLQEQKAIIRARLDAVVRPTNAELIAWAKANHPSFIDTSREELEIERINGILDVINNL